MEPLGGVVFGSMALRASNICNPVYALAQFGNAVICLHKMLVIGLLQLVCFRVGGLGFGCRSRCRGLSVILKPYNLV